MKQILKKVSALCAVAACSTAVVMSGSVVTFAAEEGNPEILEYINSAVGQLTEEIIGLSDEELAELKENGTEFAIAAVDAWTGTKEEVGAYNSIGETSVAYDDKMYSATVPADFEIYDANFVYIFDENGTPTTMTIDVQYPLSVNMKRAGMNTLMGLGTVFLVLVFLMFIISLFKFIQIGGSKKKAAAPAPAAAPVPAPVVEEEEVDDLELIAVIAAAIAASEGAASADGYVVRSIRKVNRKVR